MLAEVEDGELSSENDSDNKNKETNSNLKDNDEIIVLNSEEQNVLQKIIESGTESGEISDENVDLKNPYVEEDVRIYINIGKAKEFLKILI